MRLPSLISRFQRNTRSRDSFGVPEVMQIAEPESTRDYAHPIDAVVDGQPFEHDAIAEAIERSPPEARDCSERRVLHLPDDFWWL